MTYRYVSDAEWPPDWASGDDEMIHEKRTGSRPAAIPLLLGRLIFGGYFLYSGVNHFLHKDMMSGYAKSKGVPAAEVAVPATGALLVAGGLSLLTGYKPKLGAALIGTFLVGVSPSIHAFWKESDPQQRQADLTHFLKNLALLGGALIAASGAEPWPYSPGARSAA
jgi:putative oxidoreductase